MDENKEKQVQVEEVSLNDAVNADDATPANDDVKSGPDTDAGAADTDCGAQVEALIAEVRDVNDKYLRIAAELENTRRRAARDCEAAARNRAMSVVRSFLPVMDAVESALSHNPDATGIQAMSRAMLAAFEQVGVKKIESVGQPLNPQLHNAIQVIDAPDAATGTVVTEMQPGYMFDDTVLRTAMVVVAK